MKRIQKFNKNFINKNEEDLKIKENLKKVEEQIKEIKEKIKKMNDEYNILERYFKLVHEKIVGLDMKKIMKKKENLEVKKEEEKKSFTEKEVKDTLQLILTLRNQILEKRIKLNNISKGSEEKMVKFFSQNKNIEIELKEELRIYKELISKKKTLKNQINKLAGKQTKLKIIKKDSIKENNINIINSEEKENINDELNSKILINDNNNSNINNKEENNLNIENNNEEENEEITLMNNHNKNEQIDINKEKENEDIQNEQNKLNENNEMNDIENKENNLENNNNFDINNKENEIQNQNMEKNENSE